MNLNWPDGLGAWIGAALLLFWVVGAYNRLARLRSGLVVAQAVLETHLRRYVTLAEEACAMAQHPQESGLHGAASQLTAALNVVRLRPMDNGAGAALRAALGVLEQAWQRMLDASLPQEASAWSDQWHQITVRADMAREDLSRTVAQYNGAVTEFPAVIVAWFFGFKPAHPA